MVHKHRNMYKICIKFTYIIDTLLLFGVKKVSEYLASYSTRNKPVLSAAVLPLAHYLSSNRTLREECKILFWSTEWRNRPEIELQECHCAKFVRVIMNNVIRE